MHQEGSMQLINIMHKAHLITTVQSKIVLVWVNLVFGCVLDQLVPTTIFIFSIL